MNSYSIYGFVILAPTLVTAVALLAGGTWRRAYVLGTRLLLGALMLGGGLYKLSDNHIWALMGPPVDHAFLAKHSLELFAQFIGVAQLLIGLLLLTGRFALLGAVLLVPMWLNIIFLTWSQRWQGTPFLTTGFLILTIGLLLHDYARLKWLLYPPTDGMFLQTQRLQTGPLPVELLWWLGLGTIIGGSLLYPVSFALMQFTMFSGLLVLGVATWWLKTKRRQAAP